MATKKKLGWIVGIGVVVLILVLVGIKALQIGGMIKAGKSFVPPPETVSSARATSAEWEGQRAAVGTLVAMRGVTLSAELPGLVRDITFESGSAVRKGQALVRLDTSTEEAQLGAAEADASIAKLNFERAKSLRAGGANSPADLDTAEARYKSAQAAVATLQATIAKKTIRAPFDGRITIRQVELGQVINAGSPVASLASVTPIYVDYWLPQNALADVRAGQKVKITTDTYPGQAWQGQVTVVNPEVDVATRNVRIRATVDNPDGKLRPGMFANVDLNTGDARKVVVIPATAVLFAPYGDSVYVLEPSKDAPSPAVPAAVGAAPAAPQGPRYVARQRFVRLGERRGDFVEVLSGLAPGEIVAGTGAFKLRNGQAAVVNDTLTPDAQLAPKPENK